MQTSLITDEVKQNHATKKVSYDSRFQGVLALAPYNGDIGKFVGANVVVKYRQKNS